MNDVGPFVPDCADDAEKGGGDIQRIEACALRFHRDRAKAFARDGVAVPAQARRNRDLQALGLRGARHRQKMGNEKPILGHHEKKLGHKIA